MTEGDSWETIPSTLVDMTLEEVLREDLSRWRGPSGEKQLISMYTVPGYYHPLCLAVARDYRVTRPQVEALSIMHGVSAMREDARVSSLAANVYALLNDGVKGKDLSYLTALDNARLDYGWGSEMGVKRKVWVPEWVASKVGEMAEVMGVSKGKTAMITSIVSLSTISMAVQWVSDDVVRFWRRLDERATMVQRARGVGV